MICFVTLVLTWLNHVFVLDTEIKVMPISSSENEFNSKQTCFLKCLKDPQQTSFTKMCYEILLCSRLKEVKQILLLFLLIVTNTVYKRVEIHKQLHVLVR